MKTITREVSNAITVAERFLTANYAAKHAYNALNDLLFESSFVLSTEEKDEIRKMMGRIEAFKDQTNHYKAVEYVEQLEDK